MENMTFKSAMFGGFDREDVIRYIEKIAKENGELVARLEQTNAEQANELAHLRSRADAACAEVDGVREQAEETAAALEKTSAELRAAQEELAALRSRYAIAQSTCSAAQAALEQSGAQLREMTSRRDALLAELESVQNAANGQLDELERLRAEAAEYQAVKAHIAGIEFGARQRADALESDTRARLDAMLCECRDHCTAVLSSITGTCAAVSAQLQQTEREVATLPEAFSALCDGLAGLQRGEASEMQPEQAEPSEESEPVEEIEPVEQVEQPEPAEQPEE